MPTQKRLQALSSSVAITSRTAYHPDAASAYLTEIHFHAQVESGAVAWLSPTANRIVGLSHDAYDRLLSVVFEALSSGGGALGVDTAIGRPITTLSLTVLDHASDHGPRSVQFGLNHLDIAGRGPTPWRVLIEELAGILGDEASAVDRDHLDQLARWFRIRPPAPAFDEGAVIRCPSAPDVAVPLDDGVFVRVGQSADDRGLFLARRQGWTVRVVEVSSGREVGKLSHLTGSPWRAQGAYAGRLELSFPGSRQPNRILVDARDQQGVFVQRATAREISRVLGHG